MRFDLATRDNVTNIYVENDALAGVKRIARTLAKDIALVTGKEPKVTSNAEGLTGATIFVMTLGCSELAKKLGIGTAVEGKREVYELAIVENPLPNVETGLVVCGSDKRGTIYGMFRISRLLGVSPWVDFADVMPAKRSEVSFDESIAMVSKEPSVRYRGFFINDEWPSFGNWTFSQHGGFTAEMYERVFTLLLRMNGNYMWPAMWSSTFAEDGPGLASAELADELGVVMGNSHHEPCLRAGEEFDHCKGEDSIYGNDWNYYINRDGLLNFWRDGLKRGGHLESIITIGMRGERDTSMLGPEATLRDNIELLRDIIHEQRKLIAEHVNEDVSQVPQLLALYKEVEAYFYGDDTVPGLIGWEELDDVILLLCEDNYGNMRTLPTEEMRAHRGGYGMYYHFDYHGGPISYEWVNSTPLEKVWEQMTQAYECGVRELWIVNVGDLKPQELPLTYFMDLAYDYEAYGIRHPNEIAAYRKRWGREQFAPHFAPENVEEALAKIDAVLDAYTRMNNLRRPEALNKWTYHLTEEKEAGRMLAAANSVIAMAEWVRARIAPEGADSYTELVYYPAVASMNLIQMQIYAAINEVLLAQNDPQADRYADMTEACIVRDAELVEMYHGVADGRWMHMMSSKHIGFVNWNDEGSAAPTVHRLTEVQTGGYRPERKAYLLEPFTEAHLDVSDIKLLHSECPAWVSEELPPMTFVMEDSIISIEAEHFANRISAGDAAYYVLENYGRTKSSVKAFPVECNFVPGEESPALEYNLCVPEEGTYELTLYLAPGNPARIGGNVRFGLQIGDGMTDIIETIPEGFEGGNCHNWMWSQDVLNNIRYSNTKIVLVKGLNRIRIQAVDSGMVLQKLTVVPEGHSKGASYLGPMETYYTKE